MMMAIVHASERVHADVRRAHGEGHHRLAVREPPLLRPPLSPRRRARIAQQHPYSQPAQEHTFVHHGWRHRK